MRGRYWFTYFVIFVVFFFLASTEFSESRPKTLNVPLAYKAYREQALSQYRSLEYASQHKLTINFVGGGDSGISAGTEACLYDAFSSEFSSGMPMQ